MINDPETERKIELARAFIQSVTEATSKFRNVSDGNCLLYRSDAGDYYYDFVTRTLAVRGNETLVVLPFGQLDTTTLEFFHAKLIELGGNPPPLPAASAQARTGNLLKGKKA